MERIEFSGGSCWIENSDDVPINLDHIRIFLAQAELLGSENCYVIRFRIPHYCNHSVECAVSSVSMKGSIRYSASYGYGYMNVFRRALDGLVKLSAVHAEGEAYEKDVA